MSSVKLLMEIAQSFKGNIRAKTIYNKYWLLNCLMQEAFIGTFSSTPLQFPEHTQWFSNLSIPTLLYENFENKNNETQIHKNIRIVVGDLEISKKDGNSLSLNPIVINFILSKILFWTETIYILKIPMSWIG